MANGDAPRCLYYVKPGKANPRFPGGKYNVCITPNQHRELFGAGAPPAAPAPIGCGVFACAYPTADPDKIVKVTRDDSDVAALMSVQGLPGVPRLFSAHKLASHAFWARPERYVPPEPYSYYRTPREKRAARPTVFGLVVERLRPLDKQQRLRWRRRINCMAWQLSRDHEPRTVVKGCCPIKPKAERRACLRGGIQLARTVEKLREHGIKVGDLHAGNVGLDARGRWKILDLGQSEGAGYPDVEDLAGARRRKPKRKPKRKR
jgi:hypothetical protein